MSVVVTWCRCGPLSDLISAVQEADSDSLVSWSGDRKWVQDNNPLALSTQVLLGQADLCHRQGIVQILRGGQLASWRESDGQVELTLRIGQKLRRQPWIAAPRGKLVFGQDT